jgi:hypothetical protein
MCGARAHRDAITPEGAEHGISGSWPGGPAGHPATRARPSVLTIIGGRGALGEVRRAGREEARMLLRLRSGRDPWWDDGQGARRQRTRRQVVSAVAFALAIGACGLTTAMWMQTVAPAVGQLLG